MMDLSEADRTRRWRPALLAVLVAASCSPSSADRADIQRGTTSLRSSDRAEKALGAIAIQHVIARQSRFSLLGHTDLRWWQRELQPAVPLMIDMLADDAGLEWIDPNGNTEKVTTPRKEATLALVQLERPAVEPLIAALDRPELAPRALRVLLQITGDRGVREPDAKAWRAWWGREQREALPRERGQLGSLATKLLLAVPVVALLIFLQERLARRAERRRLSLKS